MDDENTEPKPFETAAEQHGIVERTIDHVEGFFHRGKSFTPGLTEVPDSKVPGAEHSHVHGPQQAAVDPVAAGLETEHSPTTINENRVVNRTGEIGSGPHTPGTTPAVSDGSPVVAPEDDKHPVGGDPAEEKAEG
ncbi:hypothetical protein HN018_06860 [Lichenicola cladoniae]|uniref:Uncharacterized protein n=1 Tax=Lichenicola cladoniae TaxID=1484109 RepID=A0A6M8HN99_9PROT|nr:hypothetical protein [Lichenicola cladoniae]NPD67293.1 hypothetical protein [Acetobacteraceae bacterium]QKE89796.1 hypothetical protein HN018_06860 [Lichenicola cladoniae]